MVIADVRAVAAHWPDVRVRMLAELSQIMAEAPWTLSRAFHQRARDAGIDDDALLHAIASRDWRTIAQGVVPRTGTAHAIFSLRDPLPVLTSAARFRRRRTADAR